MTLFAPAGLGYLGGAIAGMLAFFLYVTLASYFLFLLVWYSPEIVQLVSDWITGRNVMAESQQEREHEGRLFDSGALEEYFRQNDPGR